MFKFTNVYFQPVLRIRTVLTVRSTAPQIVKQEHATQWRVTARVSQGTIKPTLCVELVSNRVYIVIYFNTQTQHKLHNSWHSKN